MNTFLPSIPLPANPGVLPVSSGETSLPDAAGSSPGAFRKLMDGCMAKARGADSRSAESEQPAGATVAESESETVSLEGMVLAGLQAAEAAIMQGVLVPEEAVAQDVFVSEEAEGMEIALPPASLDFAAAISPGMKSAEDAPAEGLEIQRTDPSAAEENAVSPGMRNIGDVPVKESAVQTKDLSDTMFGKIADVDSDAVTEEDAVSPGMRNTGDVPVKETTVQAKDLSDAMFEKIAGIGPDAVAEKDAAPLLRQFPAASDSGESGSSHVVASEERNVLKESDKGFTPVREPSSSAAPTPAEAGFVGAAQETAQPSHPVSLDPAVMPQRLF
ncbi:MAG: hypothetical protein FWF95_06115, partial [Syntrophorhabdaceae bacterium]|nr:hypothetical protein [Syntrophorhabdaceae bacterium]